jgi:hypothetical protein
MRSSSETCGIHQLAEHHLDAVQELASAPAIAATTRVPHPYPPADVLLRRFALTAAAWRAHRGVAP